YPNIGTFLMMLSTPITFKAAFVKHQSQWKQLSDGEPTPVAPQVVTDAFEKATIKQPLFLHGETTSPHKAIFDLPILLTDDEAKALNQLKGQDLETQSKRTDFFNQLLKGIYEFQLVDPERKNLLGAILKETVKTLPAGTFARWIETFGPSDKE
ncbi:MAG: hypothetical protein K2X66_04725, partial [Cyanobacteria bacterium]|nr:hypothetical protein [Cyanobacteriota bacterium]